MSTYPTDSAPDRRPKFVGEYDALADLFLGGSDIPAPAARTTTPSSAQPAPLRLAPEMNRDAPPRTGGPTGPATNPVDAVLLGSLPVYASAWITQFVRAETERLDAPIALVRTLAGEGSVDVLGPGAPDAPRERHGSLDLAIAHAAEHCARFVIRTGETSEADLATHEGVDSVVILTGVDEPALIAAYRTLKSLAPRWASRPSPVRVRIAAMGATEQQGRRAFEKIARAARVFLETPLEYAGHVERIEPAPSVCLFRGPTNADVDTVLSTINHPPVRPATPGAPGAGPDSIKHPVEPAADVATPTADAAPVPERLTDRLPALAAIPFAVPRCDGVELAADASGGLHLLALDRDDASPTAALLAARAWTEVNRHVLAAACATSLGCAIDHDRPATMHLFTPRPKTVRALLDADLRVHFLGEIEVNGKRAWCVAELN